MVLLGVPGMAVAFEHFSREQTRKDYAFWGIQMWGMNDLRHSHLNWEL
jgi:hypothetical protein